MSDQTPIPNGNGKSCPFHIDHERRISNLEKAMEEIKKTLGNPAVTVAIIGMIGTIFSGACAFLGVILAPAIRAAVCAWFGVAL